MPPNLHRRLPLLRREPRHQRRCGRAEHQWHALLLGPAHRVPAGCEGPPADQPITAKKAGRNAPPARRAEVEFTAQRLERLHEICRMGETMLDMLLAKKRAADRKSWLEAKGNLVSIEV